MAIYARCIEHTRISRSQIIEFDKSWNSHIALPRFMQASEYRNEGERILTSYQVCILRGKVAHETCNFLRLTSALDRSCVQALPVIWEMDWECQTSQLTLANELIGLCKHTTAFKFGC